MDLAGWIFLDDHELDVWTDGWMRAGDAGFLAEVNGVPVGVAWYRRLPHPISQVVLAQASFCVLEEHRGKGIGTALMCLLVNAARVGGETGLGGQVKKKNQAALAVCSRVGLEEDREVTQVYSWLDWFWVCKQLP